MCIRDRAYILREWKKAQDELRGFLGDEYQDYDLVVALPNGRPCEDRIILKEFEKLREKAGLPRVVFHSLRHSSTDVYKRQVLVWCLLVAAWYVPLTIYRLIVGY